MAYVARALPSRLRFLASAASCGLAGAYLQASSSRSQKVANCEQDLNTALKKDEAFQCELAKLRPGDAAVRARWVKDEEGWRKLPPRAWPTVQPKEGDIPELQERLLNEKCPPAGVVMSPSCTRLTFDLATALVFNALDASIGLETYRGLADGPIGDVDSMVGAGVCLVEGLGVTQNDEEGIHWLRRGCAAQSAQAHFELGALYYMGKCGLDEDEAKAFGLFEKAAAQGHASAMFMVADCLLQGMGCEANPTRAVPLLMASAETGHRVARQYIRQLLDGCWNPA